LDEVALNSWINREIPSLKPETSNLEPQTSTRMRLEIIPLILGVLVALLGVGIIVDAWTPDETTVARERRRRPRVERHRAGEALIGFGVLALAGAFIARDNWRFTTVVVIIGALFLVIGTFLNFAYVRELFTNRGPLRRREVGAEEIAIEQRPGRDEIADVAPDSRPHRSRSAESSSYSGVERRQHPRGERR
jgi:hypothetical protein